MKKVIFWGLLFWGLSGNGAGLWGAPQLIQEWDFDTPADFLGWTSANHIKNLKIADGALQGLIVDWDPFVISPQFEIPATPWQIIELRLKTDDDGTGEIYWTNTTETQYGGFSPHKRTPFTIKGDNEWHVYRVQPFWQGERKIILIRLDFPPVNGGPKSFALDWIRIVDMGTPKMLQASRWDFAQGRQGWTHSGAGEILESLQGLAFSASGADFRLWSPPLNLPVEELFNLHLNLSVTGATHAQILWTSEDTSGLQEQSVPLRADGKPHIYNLDFANAGGGQGNCVLLGLAVPAGAKGILRTIALTKEPEGPPDVEIVKIQPENALNRAGKECRLLVCLHNHGGTAASGLKIARLKLPAGLHLLGPATALNIPDIPPGEIIYKRLSLRADKSGTYAVQLQLQGPGAPETPAQAVFKILPDLKLPKASYVPAPQPVPCDYEIGAFYFPGWESAAKWQCIRDIAPERKPVLGWYDESNPECADWQIKWAVENGIKFFAVDWYWSAGGRHLEHWLHKAYMQSRYRRFLKWCVMWANHNAPNTHSEADQRAVTQYWIEHYFGMPEYYRIEDMPVVIIWAPGNMRRDMGGSAGAKRLLDISQELARAAGYKGIYFIAMHPTKETLPLLREEGYAATMSYNYLGHGGQAADPLHYPYALVAQTSRAHWEERAGQDILPFWPTLSTGWDARPWHGDKARVVYGRTPALFRQICQEAKNFADERGLKQLMLAPLNEWGEGSYIEPCAEFGFEMYEVIREVFCRQPASGWPQNYGPLDVGLGPYDYPDMDAPPRTSWDFADSPQGWGAMMGIGDFQAQNGILSFVTAHRDPAIIVNLPRIRAQKFSRLIIRIKYDNHPMQKDMAQLFWNVGAGFSEASSVRWETQADGQWHDYTVDLKANNRWRGILQQLRLDPCSTQGVRVAIDHIELQ